MDYSTSPVYFDLKYHYRPFCPAAPLSPSTLADEQEDMICWVFDKNPVELAGHILDSTNLPDQLVNFTIDEYRRDVCIRLGSRVHDVCVAMASKYEFYSVEDVPGKVDESNLTGSFETEEDARQAFAEAHRTILDQLGLITWFMSVTWDYAVRLSDEMTQFLIDLRLGKRPKRGCLVYLSRDWKHLNIVHFIRHSIPFHYPWTEAEENDRKFFVYSEMFLKEYLNKSEARGGIPVPVEELPNYPNWREKLVSVDMFLQDRLLGDRRSWRRPNFEPTYSYSLILHESWGRRRLTDRREIRACVELYNCNKEHFEDGTYVTFYGHYPLKNYSPRMPEEHLYPLKWFSYFQRGPMTPESVFWDRDPVLEREKWGVKLVPWEGRKFNSYNGRPADSNERARSDPGASVYDRSYQVGQRRAWDIGRPGRPRDSGPEHRERSSEWDAPGTPTGNGCGEGSSAAMPGGPGPDDRDDSPEGEADEESDPRARYGINPTDKIDYLGAIMDWAPIVTTKDPRMYLPKNVVWDPLFLEKGILVFDSPDAQVRMRAWAAIFNNMNRIENLLNLAIRFAIPFFIFIRARDIPSFESKSIPEAERRTLPGTLEPGFTDTRLMWLGGEATRASFLDLVAKMLWRPYAGAFLCLGGFYHRGFMLRAAVQSANGEPGEEEMLARDQVSSDEVNLLFGYINKGDPSSDLYLFPPQWLLEEECPGHFHGIMSPAAQGLFEYLIGRIASPAISGCWRTVGKWRSFLRSADRKKFVPKD
ncbi:hypothetical protein DFH09DRAFT_1080710 [Mycena vulgaris]|nr:hypothetical protein DFH09DRAFT_1080710 [Mycena vulgaris]